MKRRGWTVGPASGGIAQQADSLIEQFLASQIILPVICIDGAGRRI